MAADLSPSFSREQEFPQLKDCVYLDHAGATLYSKTQINAFSDQLTRNLFANPHSRHAPSQRTLAEILKVRRRILAFFHAENYHVVFTSGATAAIKLVAETFDFGSSGVFAHLREVHTSVLGMREIAKEKHAEICCFQEDDVHELQAPPASTGKLAAFPGQCNFSGKKYPLCWIPQLQCNGWNVLLDAAALVSTSPLDLSVVQPDFVALSFYKMFGFPTGLGALLVHKNTTDKLRKTYFGGGTVEVALSEEQFHVFRPDFAQRFEDGTISFLDIIALNHGFDALEKLGGGMQGISARTFALARYTYSSLSKMTHCDGSSVVELYNVGVFDYPNSQGPVIAFNLKESAQKYVGFMAVEKVMESFRIQLRTGCFCNLGACQKYLGLTADDLKGNFNAGHVCGDSIDIVDGKPTGAIRISFGYMSSKEDADVFLRVIADVFMKKTAEAKGVTFDDGLIRTREVVSMFLYPVKSCRGVKVENWPIGPEGFVLDRKCFVQNSSGICVTLKHNAKLYDVVSSVDLENSQVILSLPGQKDFLVSLQEQPGGYLQAFWKRFSSANSGENLVDARVCGQPVRAVDCGDAASEWLSCYLQDDVYRLLKFHDRAKSSESFSAANSAPFLLICTASLEYLLQAIPGQHLFVLEDIIERMRPNLVIRTYQPFEEDAWTRIKIGDNAFEVVDKCSRCQMVSVDPRNGTRSDEPLQSIIRLRGKDMHFGILVRQTETLGLQNEFQNTSRLQKGDFVDILNQN